MAHLFSAEDIIKASVEIERRGRQVYTKAAAAAQDSRVRQFLEFFSAEEARHEEVFAKMAERLSSHGPHQESEPSEYLEYLRHLLNSHALFIGDTSDQRLAESGNMKAAIELAMRIEKDTILFFTEIQHLIPPAEYGVIRACIEEERSHFRQLNRMLASLDSV
jgi:rubrerythrin